MLDERGLAPIVVTLTNGRRVRVSGREVSLPRSSLHVPLRAAVEAGRLRVAWPMPCAEELQQELAALRDSGGKLEASGRGHHGDLLVAISLALFGQGLASLRAATLNNQQTVRKL